MEEPMFYHPVLVPYTLYPYTLYPYALCSYALYPDKHIPKNTKPYTWSWLHRHQLQKLVVIYLVNSPDHLIPLNPHPLAKDPPSAWEAFRV